MRYQEPIYIQNENSGVRNRDMLNVNMSSDVCVFNTPLFYVSGASKIDCTGSTTSYIISSENTIDIDFIFTANTDSFSANNTTFKYELYKLNHTSSAFTPTPIYKSTVIEYSAISGTSSVLQHIPVSDLGLDGDYLIKGYFDFDICTDFLKRLGKRVDTLQYKNGIEYGLYQPEFDYYFSAIYEAEKPIFMASASNTPEAGKLFQQIIIPEIGTKIFSVNFSVVGEFIVTLNGLVLAKDYDYSVSGYVVTLSSATVAEDIITIIYTTGGGSGFLSENIDVSTSVISGSTGNEGTNSAYYNTTTGKYEVYTNSTPQDGGSVIIMINGVTLANGVDYYQSTSNSRRFILEGDILVGDMITLVYFPVLTVVNGLSTNNPMVTWSISNPPQVNNGQFTLEVSTATSFTTLYTTSVVNYVPNQSFYSSNFSVSGSVGTQYYYRVKNEKSYEDICGNIISSITYSDIVPIVVQTNAINSY